MSGGEETISRTIKPSPFVASSKVARDLQHALWDCSSLASFLSDAAKRDERVLLIVNDSHRSTRTREVLLAIDEWVRTGGVAPRFAALVATGTHVIPPTERKSFEQSTFGRLGFGLDAIHWHDCDDRENLADVGGVSVNSLLADHEFLLPIGSVEPHYFAGATGAHKTVTIGCMSREGIERNHAFALHDASTILMLQGNPVYEGVVKSLEQLTRTGKRILAVNQVVRGAQTVAVEVGDPLTTLKVLMPIVRDVFVHEIEAAADVIHLKVPLPLGRSLYQADKALKNNHLAVRDGGGIILEAACPDGIGDGAFMRLLDEAPDLATALAIVAKRGYRLGDHKAVKLRHLTDPAARGVFVALVSNGVSDREATSAGLRRFDRVDEAERWVGETVGCCRHRLVIEDAGHTTVVASPSRKT